jgi:hypothetical protein
MLQLAYFWLAKPEDPNTVYHCTLSFSTAFAESKRRSLELSTDIVSASRAKDALKDNVKVLNETIKSLKSKLDNQLVQKNDHDYRMQKMKNNYKQMGLD